MQKKSPFLPGFSSLLCGKAKRRKQETLRLKQKKIVSEMPGGLGHQVCDEIPPELIEELSRSQRKRFYHDTVTFWAFLSQVLAEDASCSRTVSRVQAWMRAEGRDAPSANTASYVVARQELPAGMLQEVNRHLCGKLKNQLFSGDLWRGLHVKAIDGTSVQAPDTVANQAVYPQPSGQAEGCGFPVVQLVGLIDLSHGGVEDFYQSDIDTGELRGYDELERYLGAGDLLVADRLYSSYEVVARLKGRLVEFIGRNHQARKCDFRQGRKISRNERIQTWKKPRQQSGGSHMSEADWSALPEEMEVRIIRIKWPNRQGKLTTRYVMTTLLDPAEYPAEEVTSLYAHRWDIELRFRDIKTTMGMELLRTKSPEMLGKEILMHLIAYNLIRLLMFKAARVCGVSHRRISFKGVIQVMEESVCSFTKHANRPKKWKAERMNLYERIAERNLPDRPGRYQPRKKKRRPKSYGWLQQPRHHYFEHYRNPRPPLYVLDEAA